MENISSLKLINDLADEFEAKEISDAMPSIITVGHVCERKGFPLALKAAKLLADRGVGFNWYFLGAIDPQVNARQLVAAAGLADKVHFLGIKANPYPYIKSATIQVHPSQFEGKSIALDEAKLLCKPVVLTNFSTATDQFTDGLNGTICPMKPEALAGAVHELLTGETLRQKYSRALMQTRRDNCMEIEKLYAIFDR